MRKRMQLRQEEELLTLLKQDDIDAFDELYWKYQKAVYQNAFKLLHDSLMAEDIVQEVFISLWEKRQSIDTSRLVGGWLFVSCYNRAVNVLKKKLKESLVIKDIANTASYAEIEGDPDIHGIQIEILEQAVKELSPQKRKVFEICKIQSKTYEEAAREMNISKHTVKEYLSEAVHNVKDYAARHSGEGLLLFLISCYL